MWIETVSSRLCFVESDHCPCATADRKRLLEPDAARRLAIFELVEPLEESDDDVLSEKLGVNILSWQHGAEQSIGGSVEGIFRRLKADLLGNSWQLEELQVK